MREILIYSSEDYEQMNKSPFGANYKRPGITKRRFFSEFVIGKQPNLRPFVEDSHNNFIS